MPRSSLSLTPWILSGPSCQSQSDFHHLDEIFKSFHVWAFSPLQDQLLNKSQILCVPIPPSHPHKNEVTSKVLGHPKPPEELPDSKRLWSCIKSLNTILSKNIPIFGVKVMVVPLGQYCKLLYYRHSHILHHLLHFPACARPCGKEHHRITIHGKAMILRTAAMAWKTPCLNAAFPADVMKCNNATGVGHYSAVSWEGNVRMDLKYAQGGCCDSVVLFTFETSSWSINKHHYGFNCSCDPVHNETRCTSRSAMQSATYGLKHRGYLSHILSFISFYLNIRLNCTY